ncbi:MAG: sulfatase [Verrucomicrobiota bacterium]
MHKLLILPLLLTLACIVARADQPNIIFILIDDQGYYDLGCYGATEVETPRIDSLAENGVRFTDYYAAAPICSPSRVGILTGVYPRRLGLETWVQRADSIRGIPNETLTLPELLKQNGYATAAIGKWHLGQEEEFLPNNQGFDHYYGLLHNLDPVEIIYFEGQDGPGIWRNKEIVKPNADPAELTEIYTDETIDFIADHKDEPFFIYLAHTMLHNPLGVSPKFQGSSQWDEYGDAIQELDFNVGRILDALEEYGIADNTIVIYASDNGRGPGRNPQQPLRGRKLQTWEAGIRVPGIISGPDILQGEESSKVVSALDWYPTLASFAGIKIPNDQILDGRDLSNTLRGKKKKPLNANLFARRNFSPPGEWAPLFTPEEYRDAFFYHGAEGPLSAVRSGPWKLFLNPNLTLYNLDTDPSESTPARNGEITRKLRGMAVMFQEEMSREQR